MVLTHLTNCKIQKLLQSKQRCYKTHDAPVNCSKVQNENDPKSGWVFSRVRWGQQKRRKQRINNTAQQIKGLKVSSLFQEGEELKRYNRLGFDSEQKRQRQQKTKTNNIKQLPELFEELKGRKKNRFNTKDRELLKSSKPKRATIANSSTQNIKIIKKRPPHFLNKCKNKPH